MSGPNFWSALARAFYEPNSNPPRVSFERLCAVPCIFFGVAWMMLSTVAGKLDYEFTIPWWAGLAMMGIGVSIPAIRIIRFGEAELQKGDQ